MAAQMIAAVLLALVIGSSVSWVDNVTGERYCGKLAGIHENRAWILPDRSPSWYAIEPIANVTAGCAP